MAKITYIGNGTSHKVKKIYIGDGSSRKVKKGYIGENNLSKLFFSGETRWERYSLVTQYKWNRYNVNYTENDQYTTQYTIGGPGTYYVFSGTGYSRNGTGFTITGSTMITCDCTAGSGGQYVGTSWGIGSNRQGRRYALVNTSPTNFGSYVAKVDSDSRFSFGIISNSYWQASLYYINGIITLTTAQGSLNGSVTSTQSNTYPANGISGSYWYVSSGSEQIKGSLVDIVTSDNENAYPDNGISGNYWYVKIVE